MTGTPAAVAAIALALAACSSNSGFPGIVGSGGNGGSAGGGNAGAGASCGPMPPCGGDVVGTWSYVQGCVNNDAFAASLTMTCPGMTVSISNFALSGSVSFDADLSYATSSGVETLTVTEMLPPSCLNGITCSALQSSLSQVSQFQSVTCSGSSSCTCDIVTSMDIVPQAGTYSTSGTTITTTQADASAAQSSSYCVEGNLLHLLTLDTTMNMGPMGQATLRSAIIAQKQ
jgi:hypothetical protein